MNFIKWYWDDRLDDVDKGLIYTLISTIMFGIALIGIGILTSGKIVIGMLLISVPAILFLRLIYRWVKRNWDSYTVERERAISCFDSRRPS